MEIKNKLKARKWATEHSDHVFTIMLDSHIKGYPPSKEDEHQPNLWKPAHWTWFFSMILVEAFGDIDDTQTNSIDYKEALRALLNGLECVHVEHFINNCKIKDCEKLGKAYAHSVKEKINSKLKSK